MPGDNLKLVTRLVFDFLFLTVYYEIHSSFVFIAVVLYYHHSIQSSFLVNGAFCSALFVYPYLVWNILVCLLHLGFVILLGLAFRRSRELG